MSVDDAIAASNGTRPDEHRYTIVPSALVRDPNLSTTAKAVYLALDDRQGNRRDVHANRTTLAADLGVSVATIKRAVAELIDSGWIAREQSRYTNRYATRNPARTRRQPGHLRPVSTPSRVTDEPSAGSPMTHVSNIPLGIEKQASNSGDREPKVVESAAAAGASRPAQAGSPPPVIDQGLSDYIAAFHKVCHIDLARTRRVADALTRARGNGWTASDLAAALRDKPRSPNAGTGVVVLDLETLADNLPNLATPAQTTSTKAQTYSLGRDADLIAYCNANGITYKHSSHVERADADDAPECRAHGECALLCPLCRDDRSRITLATLQQMHALGLTPSGINITDSMPNSAWSRWVEICLERPRLLDGLESPVTLCQEIEAIPRGNGYKIEHELKAEIASDHARYCSSNKCIELENSEHCIELYEQTHHNKLDALLEQYGLESVDGCCDWDRDCDLVDIRTQTATMWRWAEFCASNPLVTSRLLDQMTVMRAAATLIDSHFPQPVKVSSPR